MSSESPTPTVGGALSTQRAFRRVTWGKSGSRPAPRPPCSAPPCSPAAAGLWPPLAPSPLPPLKHPYLPLHRGRWGRTPLRPREASSLRDKADSSPGGFSTVWPGQSPPIGLANACRTLTLPYLHNRPLLLLERLEVASSPVVTPGLQVVTALGLRARASCPPTGPWLPALSLHTHSSDLHRQTNPWALSHVQGAQGHHGVILRDGWSKQSPRRGAEELAGAAPASGARGYLATVAPSCAGSLGG